MQFNIYKSYVGTVSTCLKTSRWVCPRILKREDKRQMTSLHRHFHCFLKILIFIAGGNDSFVVKNKFRAFWCLICLCSWIRSYLPPGHGRTVTSSAVTRSLSVVIQMRFVHSFRNSTTYLTLICPKASKPAAPYSNSALCKDGVIHK